MQVEWRRLDAVMFRAQAGPVNPAARVACPPPRPLLIYDGECDFCRRSVTRWRRITGDRVDFVPFQDADALARFPEIPRADLERAVHLIEPDGAVYRGAAAALRARRLPPGHGWLWWLYERCPGFAPLAEAIYRGVAANRRRRPAA
jgi:predicted DCC family thiol-disulfide oxidoreductase YuxK